MIIGLPGKRAIVLSDNDGLSRVIEFHLKSSLLEVTRVELASLRKTAQTDWTNAVDLIVVALSMPTNDPVTVMSQPPLERCVGQVPILVISKRPCYAVLSNRVVHLDFPFEIDDLYDSVAKILQENVPVHTGEQPLVTFDSPPCLKNDLSEAVSVTIGYGAQSDFDRGLRAEYWLG